MNLIKKLYLFFFMAFFLTSCMNVESEYEVSKNGDIALSTQIDMSELANMLRAFSGGATSSGSNEIKKNLCEDILKEKETSEYVEDIVCESIWDYQARISGILPYKKNPTIMTVSGGVVLLIGSKLYFEDNKSSWDDTALYGIKIEQTFKFPYPIVFTQWWKKSWKNTIIFDYSSMKQMKKPLMVIASEVDKKSQSKNIREYRWLFQKKISKEKKSGTLRAFSLEGIY